MKTVIGVSLGADDQDFAFNARFLRQKLDVRRLGTNGSTAKAVKLLKHWEQHADAIGLGVVKDSYAVGSRRYVEKDSTRMKDAVTRVPVTTGGRLNDILQEWALRHVQIKLGDYFNNATRAVLFGKDQLQAGVGHGRVHAEPGVRRCAAAARRAQDADLARRAGALHQRRALRAGLDPRRR